jgi:pimeloyl-ACP methyl ester carboxylesterase
MKRILFAAAFFASLFLSQPSHAQSFICFEAGTILYEIPGGNNCGMVTQEPGGQINSVVAQLTNNGYPLIFPATGLLDGDLGQWVNDGGTVLSLPCQTGHTLVLDTVYTPGVHVVNAHFTRCDQYGPAHYDAQVTIVVLPPVPTTTIPACTAELIDPVRFNLQPGGVITNNRSTIVTPATVFARGVAADGVTETVVAIGANHLGDGVQLNVINDAGSPSSSSDQDGGLALLGSSVTSLTNNVSLIADTITSLGPTAFAIYRAPMNFARGTQSFLQDNTAVQRQVTLQAICPASNGSIQNPVNAPVLILRPPIVLVHGLWSDQSSWDSFAPTSSSEESQVWSNLSLNSSRWQADYSAFVPIGTPTPPFSNLSQVSGNALGFEFNAPIVLKQIRNDISSFGWVHDVAAVQADVIGHSMGGLIARTMALSNETWTFLTNDTYGQGPIEKLITIGTPHLGSPLAGDLLPWGSGQDPNSCVRNRFASNKLVALQTAYVGGNKVFGGVNDLVGDGQDTAGLSQILQSLQTYQGVQPFPMAYLAATASAANLGGLDCIGCKAWWLKNVICRTSPLAQDLTSNGWPNVFGANNPSDGIVPLKSELNGSSNGNPLTGLVHSAGLYSLDFLGPSELESGVMAIDAVDLLNEAKNGSDFQY